MIPPPTPEEQSAQLSRALATGILEDEDTAAVFYDLSIIAARADEMRRLFPPDALHTTAIKANPLPSVLRVLCRKGFGAEAASFPEILIAEASGFPTERIVFDSPAKTVRELDEALSRGVHINADSLEELKRIERLPARHHSGSRIGIRINPQIGEGSIATTSVASMASKFGVPLKEKRAGVLEAFRAYPWLTGIHVHVGSQAYPVELLVRGVSAVMQLVEEIEAMVPVSRADHRVKGIDIGGGMPATYRSDAPAPPMEEYVRRLQAKCPALFSPGRRVITEFGRSIHANAGWAVSRVEYVKRSSAGTTLITHLGADMFLREAYHPADWYHEILLTDASGALKHGSEERCVVAGPLCFSGDIIARGIPLPVPDPGDYLIIRDAGAYTLSMWSRYNSRVLPKIIGIDHEKGSMEVLKERERSEELLRFWS